MRFVLDVPTLLCEPNIFEINGISANYNDFGIKCDSLSSSPYSSMCENMQFIPKSATVEVLHKYRITEEEYIQICDDLVAKLSFGRCGGCV